MKSLQWQIQRIRFVKILTIVIVINSFLAIVDTIGVSPSKQSRQFGSQHSGTLYTMIKQFSIIHYKLRKKLASHSHALITLILVQWYRKLFYSTIIFFRLYTSLDIAMFTVKLSIND